MALGNLIIKEKTSLEVLSKKLYQNLLVVSELYRQQAMMYQQKQNRISDRIVSISQPHIRPIVRGKVASPVEFGAKISASDVEGFVYLDRLEWEARNEGEDLVIQAEAYRRRFGFYPESIHADRAYQTRKNRNNGKKKEYDYQVQN
jgi:transposase, IS5 family